MTAAHPPHIRPRQDRDGVLITRAATAGQETAARIAALGLIPVLAPLTAIEADRLRWPREGVQAVLVTSGNALGALPERALALPLLTVGDATAARAAALGHARVHSAGADAAALAALAARLLRPTDGPVLLATQRGQGRALAADLRMRGFRVAIRIAYTVRPVQILPAAALAALDGNRLGAVLLFSPAGAKLFATLLGTPERLTVQLAGIDAVAISPATARQVGHLPWRRIRVASHPTQDEMLALLQ